MMMIKSGLHIVPPHTKSNPVNPDLSSEKTHWFYLKLRNILTEGDVEDPVESLLGEPSLIQGELPNVSRVPGVSLLHQDT